jgi:hypothetical protein
MYVSDAAVEEARVADAAEVGASWMLISGNGTEVEDENGEVGGGEAHVRRTMEEGLVAHHITAEFEERAACGVGYCGTAPGSPSGERTDDGVVGCAAVPLAMVEA